MRRLSLHSQGLCLTGTLAVTILLAGCLGQTKPPAEAEATPAPAIIPVAASDDASDISTAPADDDVVVLAAADTPKPAPRQTTSQAKPQSKSNPATERPPEPMLKGWAKPALTIILSGEQNGYLEPCGCSAKQSGGFARRGDLFQQLRAKQWPMAAFDLGGTLKRSRKHDLLKFQAILQGFELMNYQALGLGPAELRLGAEELLAAHQPDKGVAFVSANTVFFGSADLGTPLPCKIVEINGVKVGVTSVLGEYYRDQVIPRQSDSANQDITVSEATAAAAGALEKIQAEKPDLTVLLSYCKVDETKELARKVPGFDIIITAGGPEEPLERTESIGKSMLVQVGGKGKHVAILGYYPQADEHLKYELVDLDKYRFKNNPDMVQLMRDFQERLTDENLGEKEKGVAHASGAGFEGAKKCGECHTKAYKKWLTTEHAKAFDDLKSGPRHYTYDGEWIPRQHDTECLACHVTGWDPREVVKFETGFASFKETPHLAGQQCENCHGPGSEHVKAEELLKKTRKGNDPNIAKWRQRLHLDTTMAQKETGCYKCHDGDNSPKFNFAEYYKKIEHRTLKD